MASGETYTTKEGIPAIQAVDGAEEWFIPTANPFGHGCCDCGLFHWVEFCLVDEASMVQVEIPAGLSLALRFKRDGEETGRLRGYKETT